MQQQKQQQNQQTNGMNAHHSTVTFASNAYAHIDTIMSFAAVTMKCKTHTLRDI